MSRTVNAIVTKLIHKARCGGRLRGLSYQGTEIFDIAAQMQERRNAGKLVPSEDILALAEKIQKEIRRQAAQGAGMAEATNARATEDMTPFRLCVRRKHRETSETY